MASKSNTTIDHDEIREWAEARNGRPATVKRTAKDGPGILRIDFPGYSGAESLKQITWDEFFKKFDESNLAFIYQDTTASGKQSRFGKFVDRGNVSMKSSGKSRTATRHRKAA
jgi:hypothetical protein